MKRAHERIGKALLCANVALSVVGCGGGALAKEAAAPASAGMTSADAAPAELAPAPPSSQPGQSRAKTDAQPEAASKSRPTAELLAYEASVTLGVYQVAESMSAVLLVSRELDGQLVVRND